MNPFTDRNPCIVTAGIPTVSGDSVAQCMNYTQLQDEIDAVCRQFKYQKPKDYGPNIPPDIKTPGVFTEVHGCLVNTPQTQAEMLAENLKATVYDSYWNKAVGKTRDPTPGLPKGMDIYLTKFGIPSDKSITAGELINPPKTSGQVIYEDKVFHKLYVYSHQDYWAGEQAKRCYGAPFNSHHAFGDGKVVDKSGRMAKRCLTWFNNEPYTSCNKIQIALRDRTLAEIGKTIDRTGVLDVVEPDHTFGKPSIQEFYSVADLLNECTPSLARRDMQKFISSANKLRQYLKRKTSEGLFNFEDFYNEIRRMDPDRTCVVSFDCIVKLCTSHKIPLQRDDIEPLLVILGLLSTEKMINYRHFVDFLNVNQPFPPLKPQHYTMPPEYKAYDQLYRAKRAQDKCDCYTHLSKTFGVPSLRTDTPLPSHPRSYADMEALGEETTVRTCLNPSIYTQYGVSHRDFLKPRSKEFIACIFKRIGVELTEEEFEELYKEALDLDKTGQVCVETFRNVLDRRAAYSYLRIPFH